MNLFSIRQERIGLPLGLVERSPTEKLDKGGGFKIET